MPGVSKKVIGFLNKHGVPYELIDHRTVYTAFDAAKTLRVKLNELVKSLMVKIDQDYYLVSLPADKNVDFTLLKKAIQHAGGTAKKIQIPGEKVISKAFKVKPGQLSGFSKLYKVKAIVDRDLKKVREVVVSGGSLTQSIRVKMADYLGVEEAVIAPIGKKKKLPSSHRPKKAAMRKRPVRTSTGRRKRA